MLIRPATETDHDAIWAIMEPVLRAGETYCKPRDWTREEALTFWFAQPHQVFVAEHEGRVHGHYFVTPNQMGGGKHVANCGYMTAADAAGKGVATHMCRHSMELARAQGFRAMQFNAVVSTNTRAVALWERMGFAVAGRLPGAFEHPAHGFVDLLVMYQAFF
jgi:ribosomal protein S18 acetylase RimI-like enzyme